MKLRFGQFLLDTQKRVLLEGGIERALEPKVFDCIALLARSSGSLVSLASVRDTLWPSVNVGQGALRRIINEARKVLRDRGAEQGVIRTRRGLGYVFVPPVTIEPDLPERQAATPAWPFVGRERELAVLRDWLALPSTGGICFLSGEAGAGKSSLLARLAAEGGEAREAREAHWQFGHARAERDAPAFWPFRELAAQLLRDPTLRARVLALAEQYPAAQPLLSPRREPRAHGARARAGGEAELRFELCQAFSALLCSLARSCQLRLAIEDVHWADDGTLALLEALAPVAADAQLRLFVSYRPEALAPGNALSRLIARSSGRAGSFSLHLEPFRQPELDALLRALELPEAYVRGAPALLERTGGNPLFVHELVRHQRMTGAPGLPPSLTHIIAERIARLPALDQALLEQAAVLGHDFSLDLLAAISGERPEQTAQRLDAAVRAGLLREPAPPSDRWQFRHALVGDALVARLSELQRQAYHHAALNALQGRPAVEQSRAELARHAFAAGARVAQSERLRLCEAAGHEALAQLAFERAASHLGRALQLLAADDQSRAGAELTLTWARARWQADDPEQEIEAAFLQAAARARAAGSAELLAEAAIGYAVGDESTVLLRMAPLRPDALALVREASRALETGPGDIAYRLAAALCWLQIEAGEPRAIQHAARHALTLTPARLRPAQRLWNLALRAAADPERALEWTETILEQVDDAAIEPRVRIDIVPLVMSIQLSHGDMHGWDRCTRALERLADLLHLPERSGQQLSIYVALPLCAPVMRAVMAGKLSEAEQLFHQMVASMQRLGLTRTREGDHNAFHILFQIFAYQGRGAQLAAWHDQLPSRSHWFDALLRTQNALERGDRDEARARFAVLRDTRFRPLLGERELMARPETVLRAADACIEIGESDDAARLYEALSPRAGEVLRDGALICWGAAARPLGELAHRLGRFADAERHLEAAIAMNTEIGHVPELVRSQLGLAKLLLGTDRRDRGGALLSEVTRRAAEHSLGSVLAQAARVASA